MMAGEEVAVAVSFAQTMTIVAMILMITTGIFAALTILLCKLTPGLTFLKAKLKGQNILMAIRRDRKADFSPGKYSAGMIETKKYGDYICDPDSVMNESKSGTRLFVASTELGATIPINVARIIQGLQDMKIPNIRIAKMINTQLHFCENCKKEILAEPHQQRDTEGKVFEWFECPACHTDRKSYFL